MEDHITLLHIIHPGRNHPMRTHSVQTSIRYKTTQFENMIGMKPPGFWPKCQLTVRKACYATSALLKSSSFLKVMCLNYIYNEICIVVLHANFILAISF